MRLASSLPELARLRHVRHADEHRKRFEADIAAKPLISLCQEGESDFSSAHGGLAVTRCSAVSEYSPSGSATDCLPTQDEPGVSSISSTI
jgi:hypothetical protein